MEKKSMFLQFWGSITFAILALVGGGIYAGVNGGSEWITAALTGVFIIAVLGVLETSLSFDNAVVNAGILKDWSPFWRKLFLTVGIFIAVFGMRAVFPVVIVAVAGNMSMGDTINLALTNPTGYGEKLDEIHYLVAAFGGAFLMMVALGFFLEEKQVYWWEWAERKLAAAGEIESISVVATILTVLGVSQLVPDQMGFFMAGLWGVITFVLAHGLSSVLEKSTEDGESEPTLGSTTVKVATGGSIAGFAYLEILDASFSFDGVIGAFAVTNNLVYIILGLSIGAFFVRSMTLYLVNEGTLTEFRYLEHGAFAAIAVLVAVMFISGAGIHIPEAITGLAGAVLILGAWWRSVLANKQDALLTE